MSMHVEQCKSVLLLVQLGVLSFEEFVTGAFIPVSGPRCNYVLFHVRRFPFVIRTMTVR